MKKEEIRNKIQNDEEFAVGALLSLYQQQVPEEQMAKTTAVQNARGFNKMDSGILSSISQFYLKKGYLTPKQIRMIIPKLLKYAEQLSEIGVEKASLKEAEEKKKQDKDVVRKAKSKRTQKIELSFTFDPVLVDEVKKINGRLFNKEDKTWYIPKTATNIEKIKELGFNISEELEEWYKEQTEGITDDIDVPGLNNVLRPFQKEAVSFVETKNGRALIADEMGLGKSLESLAYLQLYKDKLFPTIIVCPASVKLNWKAEIKKWTDLGKYTEILQGSTPYAPSKDKQIFIINYDILKNWHKFLISKMKPNLIIGDEIHLCKNKNAKRSQALAYIAKYTRHFIGLTGTPILNKPVEIYNPIKMIKPTLFPNFWNFATRYCNPINNGFGWDFGGATNTAELNQILSKEMLLRRKKEDVAKELPERSFVAMPIEITNRDEYEKAEEDLISYLKTIDKEKAKRAERAEVLTKVNVLKQLALKGKMNTSINWIEEFIENEKLVVFTNLRETSDILKNKFGDNCVKLVGGMTDNQKNDAINKFWNDSARLFVGNMKAAGVGINLQCASNACFIEYPWQPGDYNQCTERIHRIGQDKPVTIYNHIANKTIEENIVKLLEKKAVVANQVIDGTDTDEDSGVFNELIKNL